MTRDRWAKRVGQLLAREYAITPDDAGLDQAVLDRHYDERSDPADFVRWFAAKFDLISKSELGLRRSAVVMSRVQPVFRFHRPRNRPPHPDPLPRGERGRGGTVSGTGLRRWRVADARERKQNLQPSAHSRARGISLFNNIRPFFNHICRACEGWIPACAGMSGGWSSVLSTKLRRRFRFRLAAGQEQAALPVSTWCRGCRRPPTCGLPSASAGSR